MLINQNYYNEPLWKITIGTGIAWVQAFEVYARHETEAVDLVADYIEEHEEFEGLYADHYGLADCCEVGETVDEYAEANQLVCCGNHGIYIQVLNIKKVDEFLNDLHLEQTEQM